MRPSSSLSFLRYLIPYIPTATSNAPTIGRKRRISDEDDCGDDVQDAGSSRKRRAPLQRDGTSELGELRVKGTETDPGVKEVTRGVKVVELDDKKEENATDDGKGTAEEAPATPEGEPSITPPNDPTDLPSTVPNGEANEASVVQSEAIAEAPSNESPDARTPEEPVAQVEDEKESTGAAPDADNDEAARATEPVDPSSPSPEPDVTPEANDCTLPEE